jgi:hypothetical protein
MKDSVQKKLDELNKPIVEEAPYNLPIGEIAIKTKDAIFNIIDDLLNFNFSWDVLTKENRLFLQGSVKRKPALRERNRSGQGHGG